MPDPVAASDDRLEVARAPGGCGRPVAAVDPLLLDLDEVVERRRDLAQDRRQHGSFWTRFKWSVERAHIAPRLAEAARAERGEQRRVRDEADSRAREPAEQGRKTEGDGRE